MGWHIKTYARNSIIAGLSFCHVFGILRRGIGVFGGRKAAAVLSSISWLEEASNADATPLLVDSRLLGS